MIFKRTQIEGAWVVDLECLGDDRGFFARAWCQKEFAAKGITAKLSQANLSFSQLAGTVRGMHFQRAPHKEMKVMRCLRGAVYDVVLDMRPDSPTYCQWHGEELSADNHRMLVIPEGCAHGFQTLMADTEVFYLVSEAYASDSEGGVRWDDSAFDIKWPLSVSEISKRDAGFQDFKPEAAI